MRFQGSITSYLVIAVSFLLSIFSQFDSYLKEAGINIPKSESHVNKVIKVPTPTPFMIPNEKNQPRLLALGAILAMRNGESLDTLNCQLPVVDVQQEILFNWWGVENHQQAIDTLKWLKNAGHSQEYREIRSFITKHLKDNENKYREFIYDQQTQQSEQKLDASVMFALDWVWQHRIELEKKELKAWDLVRMVNVARWSYSAGYISEKEAWQYIVYANDELKKYYTSWDQLAQHYLLGRTFWQQSENHWDLTPSIEWLKTNPTSPWLRYKW